MLKHGTIWKNKNAFNYNHYTIQHIYTIRTKKKFLRYFVFFKVYVWKSKWTYKFWEYGLIMGVSPLIRTLDLEGDKRQRSLNGALKIYASLSMQFVPQKNKFSKLILNSNQWWQTEMFRVEVYWYLLLILKCIPQKSEING